MSWRAAGVAIFGFGLVAGALASPAPGAREQAGDPEVLRLILSGMMDADPVACELGLIALDGRSFGWSAMRAAVEGEAVSGVPARELLEWVSRPPRDPALVPLLREALTGTDRCAARVSARLLGRMGTTEALAVLVATSRADTPMARRNAALGLGFADRREAFPDLLRLLGDTDPAVRATAAWALGEIEDPAAAPALIRVLAGDADATARRAAAWALGRID